MTRKRKSRHFACIILAILISLTAVLAAISAYRGATVLDVVEYEIPCFVSETIRIIHLTDLHSHIFGEHNDELAQLVALQEPDLIFMTGDMLDSDDESPEVVITLIQELVQIAPVYYGYGNHEKQWEQQKGKSLATSLREAGAVVLDSTYLDVTINGQELRIGGYYGYYRAPHMVHDDPAAQAADDAFFDDFENTDRLKLLLCHIPTAWVDWNYIDKYPVDIVFSGHYHGGMIRIPFVGGVVAPYVGLFPHYTEGMFPGEKATCILSTGLGTSMDLPRINNLPQLAVVDLLPQE